MLNPWQWYCSTRTFSNSFETTLTIAALCRTGPGSSLADAKASKEAALSAERQSWLGMFIAQLPLTWDELITPAFASLLSSLPLLSFSAQPISSSGCAFWACPSPKTSLGRRR